MTQALSDHALFRVLAIDPLGEMCDLAGVHHSDEALGDAVTLASIPVFQAKSEVIEREMSARGDTHPRMSLAEFEAALTEEGFERVLEEPVAVSDGSAPSDLLVWAHREGMLVTVCTYGADRRPGGMNPNLALNWKGDYRSIPFPYGGTVGPSVDVADLAVNISEGLRLKLSCLRANGKLVSPWVRRPMFISFLSYKESCELTASDRANLTAQRVAKLPEWVLAFMTPSA